MNEGFEDVYQLDGGILRYLKDVQDENLWEGECFVFDERVTVDKNLKPGNFLQCFGCKICYSLATSQIIFALLSKATNCTS